MIEEIFKQYGFEKIGEKTYVKNGSHVMVEEGILFRQIHPAANFVSELRFDNESELDNILTVLCSD